MRINNCQKLNKYSKGLPLSISESVVDVISRIRLLRLRKTNMHVQHSVFTFLRHNITG